MDPLTMVLIFVVMIGAMYLLMIRPANKRMREQQEAQAKLGPGDRVVLPSGIFATIKYVGDKTMVVELAPDVLITILKSAVGRKAEPNEEEFEFEDDDPTFIPADGADPSPQARSGELGTTVPSDGPSPVAAQHTDAAESSQPAFLATGTGSETSDEPGLEESRPGTLEER